MVVFVRSRPIAQAFVLRWVLMGGISTDRVFVVVAASGEYGSLRGSWKVWLPVAAGSCLAHCWVLRQQDRIPAMVYRDCLFLVSCALSALTVFPFGGLVGGGCDGVVV